MTEKHDETCQNCGLLEHNHTALGFCMIINKDGIHFSTSRKFKAKKGLDKKSKEGICRRCKKFADKHYGELLFCYGDSKSEGKFVSYKWKKAQNHSPHLKREISHEDKPSDDSSKKVVVLSEGTFNLSEKIHTDNSEMVPSLYPEDVKEFIRRLKEVEIVSSDIIGWQPEKKLKRLSDRINKEIDKLAGEELR